MPGYDPRFWEIQVDPKVLDTFASNCDSFADLFKDDKEANEQKEKQRAQTVKQIKILINTKLTSRQKEILDRFYFQGKTQAEIAEELGINQQVVSKHLFGVMRNDKKIGGAMNKLKKICQQNGLSPLV